jgi:DNA-binding LytR/AlgR family response regulator
MMTVLIIEDETRAAARIEKLILKLVPGAEIKRKIDTVRDAVNYFQSNPEPDLVFADIQLADGLSFEIFKKVKIGCPVIFTTAYDQYAIEAFNTNGIDYLLKPVEEKRLAQALEKLRNLTTAPDLDKILKILIEKPAPGKRYKNRFIVRVGEQIKTFSAHEIVAFYSFDRATFLHSGGGNNYIVGYALDQLENLLHPEQFFRVNRKYILNIEACKRIYAWTNSRLKIEVPGLDEDIVVARERVSDFKAWLDN